MEVSAREFGKLEATVQSLREELTEHKEESRAALTAQSVKIDELLALANKGKGAWWAGLTIASGIGALAGFLSHIFFKGSP